MNLDLNDLLGHLAYLFIFAGMFLLSKKVIWGWVVKAVGDAMWLWIGIQIGMSSIWLWEIAFLGTTAYGFYEWRKDKAQ